MIWTNEKLSPVEIVDTPPSTTAGDSTKDGRNRDLWDPS
jgi:hypothetical protein